MNNFEFYSVALNNITLFIFSFLFSIILHFIIFRKKVSSILDPYFLMVISSVFCLSVVLLLFFTNNISFFLFSSYALTQTSFFYGFSFFKVISSNQVNPADNTKSYLSRVVCYYFFSFIYLTCQIIIFQTKGIPLFMESRLETFANGSGEGILSRIADVSSIFSLYAFFGIIRFERIRISDFFIFLVFFLIFITFFLSGSKSSFLIIFTVFWCYILFSKQKGFVDYEQYYDIVRRNFKKILAVIILVVISIIVFQSSNETNDNTSNPFLLLSLRFIHSGDIFWYSYPSNIYLQITNQNWFSALFTDTLGLLRITSWKDLPEAIGITLKNIHHPSEIVQGPNARHNIFGLIYFGYLGSIIFSFLIGLTISFVRNRLFLLLENRLLDGFIFCYLMIKISALDTDPMLTITYINNLMFIFPPLYIAYLFVNESLVFFKYYE